MYECYEVYPMVWGDWRLRWFVLGAAAGTINIDFATQPLGKDSAGEEVFLRDLWPSTEDVSAAIKESVQPELFRSTYAAVGQVRRRVCRVPGNVRRRCNGVLWGGVRERVELVDSHGRVEAPLPSNHPRSDTEAATNGFECHTLLLHSAAAGWAC